MTAGVLDCMTTPAQSVRIPQQARFGADNGRFGRGWPGEDRWWAWLTTTIDRYSANHCNFAVAPDEPMNAEATLRMSLPWLPRIRDLGVPAAFVAQDGCEDGQIPWPELDTLFLGGSTTWKTGPGARHVAQEAAERGIPVHMGRVNSLRRLRLAAEFGCSTADGTCLAYGPDKNLPRLLSWLQAVHANAPLPGL
jgi:transposase InsO family protein